MMSLHARIAALALVLVLLWGILMQLPRDRTRPLPSIDIGVEHEGSAAIALTFAVTSPAPLIDIGNEGKEPVRISLPDTWQRGEVRFVPLAAIDAKESGFGYRSWTLPPRAVLSFRAPSAWNALSVFNPSGTPLFVRVVRVNLTTSTTEHDAYIVTKEALVLK